MKLVPAVCLGFGLVAGLTSPATFARADEVDGVTLERHSDRKGSDYADFRTQNARECARECARDRRCRAFAFWTDKKRCWLKDRVPERYDYGPSVSGVKRDNHGHHDGGHHGGPPPYPRDMDIEPHTDRAGSDYHHEKLPHAANCARLCDRDYRCRAFSYNKDQQLCWLKDSVPRAKHHDPSVSGVKRGDGGGHHHDNY